MNRRDSNAMRDNGMKVTSIVHSARQRLWHGTASKDDSRYRWFFSDGSSFRIEREDRSRAAAMAARRPNERWEERCWQYLDREDHPAGAKRAVNAGYPGSDVSCCG
jgi:hypothetical protein